MVDAARPAPPGPRAYRGPLAILTDAECASSCESTLQALRRHPGARVFGERTAGYVNFGDIGTLRLLHSGIDVSIATRYLEFEGGRVLDKVGFEPDVTVAPGHDALDTATAWLGESLARPHPP